MLNLKICKIGDDLGLVLPPEALTHLQVQDGDTVCLIEAPDGSYKLTSYDSDFEKKMKKADEIMHRYRNTLRALAE